MECMNSTKMLIETSHMKNINDHVCMRNEDSGYSIYVTEIIAKTIVLNNAYSPHTQEESADSSEDAVQGKSQAGAEGDFAEIVQETSSNHTEDYEKEDEHEVHSKSENYGMGGHREACIGHEEEVEQSVGGTVEKGGPCLNTPRPRLRILENKRMSEERTVALNATLEMGNFELQLMGNRVQEMGLSSLTPLDLTVDLNCKCWASPGKEGEKNGHRCEESLVEIPISFEKEKGYESQNKEPKKQKARKRRQSKQKKNTGTPLTTRKKKGIKRKASTSELEHNKERSNDEISDPDSGNEAEITWTIGKAVGLTSNGDDETIEEIRKAVRRERERKGLSNGN